MLHIVQHPKTKKYEVVSVAKNGEMLSISNQGFENKQGCYKHIRSQMKNYATGYCYFQDDTLNLVLVYVLFRTGVPKIIPDNKPQPKYIMASRKKKA